MKDDLEQIRHHANQALEEIKQGEDCEEQLAKIKGKANQLKDVSEEVYTERNTITIYMLRLLNSLNVKVAYKEDKQLDEPWNVWYVKEQEHYLFGHIGQMGWHIHENEWNPEEMPWIEQERQEYDGHDTQEKLYRLENLVTKVVDEVRKESIGYEDIEAVHEAVEELWEEEEEKSRAMPETITKATGLKREDVRKALHKLEQEDRVEVHETVGRTKFYKVK